MKRVIFSATAGLTLVAAICAVWVTWSRSFPGPLPAPTGPYAVGITEFDWRDDARPRELDVLVWYPAEHRGTTPSAYVRGNWLRDVNRPFPLPNLQRAKTHSWADVPPAKPQSGGWPVAILCSGFGALPADYSSLAEDLTSHGYVVVAPANTHYGLTVVFPDGRIAKEVAELPPQDELVQIWADDIRSVIKLLGHINADSRSAFYHKLALRRLGVIGHSFGGAAAAQFCVSEPSCAAGIDMDGAIYADAPNRGIRAPFLFLLSDGTTWFGNSKSRRQWTDTYREYVATVQATCAISAECHLVIEKGFRHANFTDSAALFRPPLVWFHPSLGSVERYEGLATLRLTIADFLGPRLNPITAIQRLPRP
jgi:dienelactone hydrolase